MDEGDSFDLSVTRFPQDEQVLLVRLTVEQWAKVQGLIFRALSSNQE